MSSRKKIRMMQSSVNDDTTSLRRSTRVCRSLTEGESEEEPSRKKPIGRCKNKRKCIQEQDQQFPEHPLVSAGHEMPPGKMSDGVPAVKLPSLPEQEKPMGHETPTKETMDGVPVVEHPSLLEEEKRRCHETPTKETVDGVPVVEHPSSLEEEKPRCHEMPLGETRDGVPAMELPSLLRQEKPMGHQMPTGETRDVVPAVQLPSLAEQEKPMGHEMPSGEAVELPSFLEQEKPMGNEKPCGETRITGSVVEIPDSPQEEKPNIDLLFLLEKARKPNPQTDDPLNHREHLLNAASVLKFKLVIRLTSSVESLRTKDMILLANRCFSALVELEDDYTSFHSEVKKLIAQHQQVEFAAKDKESWSGWDIKARYMQQVQCLSSVEEKLSSAQDKLTTAKANLEFLKLKKIELLRRLTTEMYEEEERVKTLTAERDQFQKSHSDIKDGIDKLDAEKAEASVEFKAIDAQYNSAKKEFEKMCSRLLQLVKY